jgi:hypothetical protein
MHKLLWALVLAYMLPGVSLMRKVEENRFKQGVYSLVVHGSFTLTGDTAEAMAQKLGKVTAHGELSVPAVATYKYPGRCRIDLLPNAGAPDAGAPSPAAPHPFASSRNGVLSSSDDMKDAALLLQFACPLLSSRGDEGEAARLTEHLRRQGVDFETTSLARDDNTIAEVIGAGPHDELKPQIWIDKNEFVPLRLILKSGGAFYDIHFDPGVGMLDPHPRAVALSKMGAASEPEQLLARFNAEKMEPNAKVDDKQF